MRDLVKIGRRPFLAVLAGPDHEEARKAAQQLAAASAPKMWSCRRAPDRRPAG